MNNIVATERNLDPLISNRKGQSVIEFLMTFTIVIGMLLFFFKMAIGFTNGYLVHYATFMSSRAYLSNDNPRTTDRDGAALRRAREVFDRLLPRGFITNFNGTLKDNDPDATRIKAYVGLYTEFQQAFSGGVVGGRDLIQLRSESFLGREPTRDEVLFQICSAIKKIAFDDCESLATLDDNGY